MTSTFVPLATLAPLVVNPARAQTNTAPTQAPMTLVCDFVKGPPTRRPFPVELFIDLDKHSVKKVYPGSNDSSLFVDGQTFTAESGLVEIGVVHWGTGSKLDFGSFVKQNPNITEENVLDFDTGILESDAGDVHQCRKAESLR